MVKKTVSLEAAVLDGLRKAVEALSGPIPLNGPQGVFPKGPNGKKLAESAIENGFLTKKEGKIKSGTKTQTVIYGIITEKGIRQVVEADSCKAALETLLPAVQALAKQPPPPNSEAFRVELTRATETCVNVIKETSTKPEVFRAEITRATEVCVSVVEKAFTKLEGEVLKVLSRVTETSAEAIKEAFTKLEGEVLKVVPPSSINSIEPGMVLNALLHTLQRVEPPAIPTLPSEGTTAAPPPVPPPVPSSALEDAVEAFVNSWGREKTVGCQFDVLWNHLNKQFPDLTIGAFQDALRNLDDANRVQLGGWARMLDEIPQPQLALFVSSKVMYYAHPTRTNRQASS